MGQLSVENLHLFYLPGPNPVGGGKIPLLINSDDSIFTNPKKGPRFHLASVPAQTPVSVFPGTSGVSTADSDLGADCYWLPWILPRDAPSVKHHTKSPDQ